MRRARVAARIQEVDYATVLGMVHVCNVFCGWEVRNAVFTLALLLELLDWFQTMFTIGTLESSRSPSTDKIMSGFWCFGVNSMGKAV